MRIKYLTLDAPDVIFFHYHGDKEKDIPCIDMPQVMDKTIVTGVTIAVNLDNDDVYERYLDMKERGHIVEERDELNENMDLDGQAILTMVVKEQ